MITLCTTYLGTSSFQVVLVFIGPPTIASVRWEEVLMQLEVGRQGRHDVNLLRRRVDTSVLP